MKPLIGLSQNSNYNYCDMDFQGAIENSQTESHNINSPPSGFLTGEVKFICSYSLISILLYCLMKELMAIYGALVQDGAIIGIIQCVICGSSMQDKLD